MDTDSFWLLLHATAARNWNTTAAAEVPSAVLTGTAHTTNVATRNKAGGAGDRASR